MNKLHFVLLLRGWKQTQRSVRPKRETAIPAFELERREFIRRPLDTMIRSRVRVVWSSIHWLRRSVFRSSRQRATLPFLIN